MDAAAWGSKRKARDIYANQSKHRVFTNPPAIMKCARDISQSLRAKQIRRKNAKQEKICWEWKTSLGFNSKKISRERTTPRHKHISLACKNVLGLQIFFMFYIQSLNAVAHEISRRVWFDHAIQMGWCNSPVSLAVASRSTPRRQS